MNQYRKRQQEKQNGKQLDPSEEPVYTKKELGSITKEHTTLEAMPEEQRNRAAERIVYDKLMQIRNHFAILANNVKDKGFLSPDPNIQKEIILGCDAFHEYFEPLTNDKWTQGNWTNSFEQTVSHLNKDNHWTEDPEFVREYRYQIFADGTVTNRHPYTSEHILGGSIIPKINNVILISDCIPFLALLFENDRQTRHKQILKREDKRKEKVRKSGKT